MRTPLKCTFKMSNNQAMVCERSLLFLFFRSLPHDRHAVVAQPHEVKILVAVSPSTEDPSAGSPQTRRLPPVRKIAEALLTDHVGTRVPEAISTVPGFIRSMGAHHPVQIQRSPTFGRCMYTRARNSERLLWSVKAHSTSTSGNGVSGCLSRRPRVSRTCQFGE